ncbi:hypothetical protein G6011_03034 [Alternaria panax]|uniref:Uncharacterized protein n=1 Tax=Alternaria panax TaxID=48097 RepID=A0AAD4F8E7_9PLEO|nr:hypothetical protein G6011_03034 [Alternaria panax]
MAEWRISDECPLREFEGLDHERCAALHNYIVELGWVQRGLALDTLDKRTWWECYGGDAVLASVLDRLDATVVSFLKAAWHGFAMEPVAKPHCFHRYLACLCPPERLWENINYAEDEDDSNKRRFVTLYWAAGSLSATHLLGLVLDQDECTAMQHTTIHDTDITMNGRQLWLPLEMILDGFVDMIDQGKVLAVDDGYNGEQERIEPWIMPSYTERDLQDTLQAFEQLVDAIHARMPSQPQNTRQGLLDLVTGGNAESLPSNSFAHRFLTQCSKPAFTYIAPGLSMAQYQPFAPTSEQVEADKLYPLLLFSSKDPAYQETRRTPWGEDMRISPFAPEFDHVSSYPAGLYLTETNPYSIHPFEDGSKLILPFTLGSNAFARTSDGALIGEHVRRAGDDGAIDIEPKSTELYQLGFNHYISSHDVQLRYVLEKWVEMVEEGKWQVDQDGVVGGIEKWREADTEANWSDYQLLMSW